MCEKCDSHLVKEHLLPLLGRSITTERNVLLKVEGFEPGNSSIILRRETGREFRIIVWDTGVSESLARAHSFLHHGGTIEGIHIPNDNSLWSRFSREHPDYLYAILKTFHDVEVNDKRAILKLKEQSVPCL